MPARRWAYRRRIASSVSASSWLARSPTSRSTATIPCASPRCARGLDGAEVEESPLLRHRGRYLRLKPFLSALVPSGSTALLDGVSRYLGNHRERGMAVVISDFLVSPDLYERALERLQARRFQVQAIQVVGREERALEAVGGRLRLRDSETGGIREVVLSAADRRRYAAAFVARVEAIRSFCHRNSIGSRDRFGRLGHRALSDTRAVRLAECCVCDDGLFLANWARRAALRGPTRPAAPAQAPPAGSRGVELAAVGSRCGTSRGVAGSARTCCSRCRSSCSVRSASRSLAPTGPSRRPQSPAGARSSSSTSRPACGRSRAESGDSIKRDARPERCSPASSATSR